MTWVSIIVPVRNEAANIRRTLEGLVRQDFPVAEFEILVVDGESDDNSREIVAEFMGRYPQVFLVANPKRLASAARNIGVSYSRGEYIVIIDGHCEVSDRRYLQNLVDAFESSGADTLGRPQPLRAQRPTPLQRAVAAARESWLGHNPDSAIFSDRATFVDADNVAVAYRREVFDRVGLFDESFDACEDVDLNTRVRRAGLSCYFTPTIAVDYQPRASIRSLAYQMMRYGAGRARLGQKFPGTVSLPSLIPPLWLAWLVIGVGVSVAWLPAGLVLAASVGLYLSVLVVESIRIARKNVGVRFGRLPFVFAAIHAGFGWGYWKQTAAALRFNLGRSAVRATKTPAIVGSGR